MPKKFIKSIKYAKAGAEHALRTQRNLWFHCFIGLMVLAFGIWIKVSLLEFCILVLTVFGVIVAEMMNTAIEELVNILSPGHRVEAALAKNVAAGAVLLAVLGAVIVGSLIFVPKLMELF